MGLPVKQHIIPRVLLKNFCYEPPFTFCLNKQSKHLKKVSINKYPTSNNIYTLDNFKGNLSYSLEMHYSNLEHFFNKFYTIYKDYYGKRFLFSDENGIIPPYVAQYFTEFAWMIFFRTKSYNKYSTSLISEIKEKEIKEIIDISKTKREEIIKQVHLGGVINFTNNYLPQLYSFFPHCGMFKFKEKIIISDNPVILLNENKFHMKNLKGKFLRDCHYLLIPIDEYSIFVLSKNIIKKSFLNGQSFNSYQMMNCDNYIFSSDIDSLKNIKHQKAFNRNGLTHK